MPATRARIALAQPTRTHSLSEWTRYGFARKYTPRSILESELLRLRVCEWVFSLTSQDFSGTRTSPGQIFSLKSRDIYSNRHQWSPRSWCPMKDAPWRCLAHVFRKRAIVQSPWTSVGQLVVVVAVQERTPRCNQGPTDRYLCMYVCVCATFDKYLTSIVQVSMRFIV
jgi:hypothetical protein